MDWQTIYKHLKNKGFDVYSMGQHKGECKSPYVVIRNNGATTVYSVTVRTYELLIYVPFDQYSRMEEYTASVKSAMLDLFPAVQLADDEQPHYPDDDVRAYMTSVIYNAPTTTTYRIPVRMFEKKG